MTDERSNRDSGRADDEDRHLGGDPEGEPAIDANEERLFILASQIDQGQPIDWEAAEREARDEHERAVIAEMRLLADVARVGREQAIDAMAEAAAASGAMSVGASVTGAGGEVGLVPLTPPATWGALTIQSPIGRGAFATVYRAQDNLGRLVALKLFPLQRQHGIDWTARLLYEGRLLARIKHEHVVSVYGADQGDGYVGLWMELIQGRTLEDELRMRVRFSADEAAQVGRALCRALAAVHQAGLLHRDVKAHNVMRDESGRIVLMDFGSSRDTQIDWIEETAPVAELAGTPLYLAPEVFKGQPASIASDIYSLGVLLFHLVSNRYPVEGTNRSEIQRAHAERRRLWLRDVRPDLPEAFVRIVERALSADRGQRYQSAGELEDALGSIGLQSSAASSGGSAASSVRAVSSDAGDSANSGKSGNSDKSDNSIQAGGPRHDTKLRPRWQWQALATGGAIAFASIALGVIAPMMGGGTAARPDLATSTPPASASPAPSTQTPSQAQAQTAAASLAVRATFYKQRKDGHETTLAIGDRVNPGDRLGLRLTTSKDAYVYIANQDDEGDGFLLYPLHREVGAPLQGNREHRLPTEENGDLWTVTSPGVREHVLVFVSQTPLTDFDQLWHDLPRAERGRPVTGPRIPRDLMMRGIGGLSRAVPTPSRGLQRLFEQASPLSAHEETVDGAWIRELTLVNPITTSSRAR